MVSDDRGQLLLFGGIVIAIVFLVAIALANSLVATQNVAAADNAQQIEQVDNREASVIRDVREIVKSDSGATQSEIQTNLDSYVDLRTTVSGPQSGVLVGVAVTSGPPNVEVEITFTGPETEYTREETITVP